MSGSRQPKISISNLQKAFGANRVLRGVDLDIGAGTSVVVIGGSGSGKSVLIKCLVGLLRPDAGQILVDGMPSPSAHRTMGILFQHAALFDSLTIMENVAFGPLNTRGLHPREAERIARDKLAQVGIADDILDMPAGGLPGGMRKRVGLARAIALEPEILLFDEPTTGLDPIMSDVINGLIVRCVRDLGATALTITHDMESAERIGDRIAMLHGGRIIWNGPAQSVRQSGHSGVDQFVRGRTHGPLSAPEQGTARQ